MHKSTTADGEPTYGYGRVEGTILSPTKSAALTACLTGNGTLYKRFGAWSPIPSGYLERKISGVTVKDLVRDGMLTLTVIGKYATARLTPYGEKMARIALGE